MAVPHKTTGTHDHAMDAFGACSADIAGLTGMERKQYMAETRAQMDQMNTVVNPRMVFGNGGMGGAALGAKLSDGEYIVPGGIWQSTVSPPPSPKMMDQSKHLKFMPIKNGYLVLNGNDQHYCTDLDAIGKLVVTLLAAHMMEVGP